MRAFSPYQFNPQNLNPLRELLDRYIQYERVVGQDQIKLFINTTHVATGLRIFREYELSTDVVLASATLPQLFQTPLIDGEGYWDGGYVANPAIEPMTEATDVRDVLVVQLNPWCARHTEDAAGDFRPAQRDRVQRQPARRTAADRRAQRAGRERRACAGKTTGDPPASRRRQRRTLELRGSSRRLAEPGFLNERRRSGARAWTVFPPAQA